jgi:hypothetical protein
MPVTVLAERYWREISAGLAEHAVPVRLHAEAEAVDTTHLTPARAALRDAKAV